MTTYVFDDKDSPTGVFVVEADDDVEAKLKHNGFWRKVAEKELERENRGS